MWGCLFFYFEVDVREEQLIRAFSFGKDLCWSLFSLVMQTAVFIVSPIQCTSGLRVRICMSSRLCVRSHCWGHYVWTCAEAWKQVALSQLCWVLGDGAAFGFAAFWFCCLMLFDAVWCMSLTGLGFLEERMIWSGLWPWCSIKEQSQAARTWTPPQQGSANNTWKEWINLSWENYNSIQSGTMQHGWSLLNLCNAVVSVLFPAGGRRNSWITFVHEPGKITSSSITQFNEPFYCLAGEVYVDFFKEQKHFFNSWALFAFENHYLPALVTFFIALHQCSDVTKKTIWKSWRDKCCLCLYSDTAAPHGFHHCL